MFENENNETLVTEVTENAGQQPAEEVVETTPPVKTYTQAEVDEIAGRKKARIEAKLRKEYDRKYGELEATLNAGLGTSSVEEAMEKLKSFYADKGIPTPKTPSYSDRDIEILARAEAEDIISGGLDEVVEEVDRLAGLGVGNMSAKDKAVFKRLAEYRESAERGRELSEMGVTEEVYNSEDFKQFAAKFNSKTPVRDIYEIYSKTKNPQKEIKTAGSMKTTASDDGGVKEYYSPEEAKKFTMEDLNKNPKLVKAIENSMKLWK